MNYKIYRVNDWAFVAAIDLQQAIDWHRAETGDDADPGWSGEESPELPVRADNGGTVTMKYIADQLILKGARLPFFVAADAHYA